MASSESGTFDKNTIYEGQYSKTSSCKYIKYMKIKIETTTRNYCSRTLEVISYVTAQNMRLETSFLLSESSLGWKAVVYHEAVGKKLVTLLIRAVEYFQEKETSTRLSTILNSHHCGYTWIIFTCGIFILMLGNNLSSFVVVRRTIVWDAVSFPGLSHQVLTSPSVMPETFCQLWLHR